ncbi:MAG: hypothetical protein AMXMBFR64_22410 [Myxococcales bacterium]
MIHVRKPRRPVPLAVALAALAGLLSLSGCPDPEGRYEEFVKNTHALRDISEPDTGAGTLTDVNGTFLLGIAPVISPTSVLQFTTVVTWTPNDDPTTGGKLKFDLQPIQVAPGQVTREPVGGIIVGNADVAADGSFEMDLGEQDVTGLANPISGSDITATLKLKGKIRDSDTLCGTVEGDVTAPIQVGLNGSTFGMTRIESTAAADLPEPLGACPAGTGGEDAGGTDGGAPDAGPTEDAGPDEDAGPGEDVDAGPIVPTCPTIDLTGTYTLKFITDTQKGQGAPPSELGLRLEASDEEGECFTGALLSLLNPGEELATIEKVEQLGSDVVFTAKNFKIPPGANPLLPNGGTANITFTASLSGDGRLCGTIVFGLFEPFALNSNGTFAAALDGGGWAVGDPECAGLKPDCSAVTPWAGTYELMFITDTQKGQGAPPTELELLLEVGDAVCLRGGLMSKVNPGEELASVQDFTKTAEGFTFVAKDFAIPAGANPLLPNGGKANITFTAGSEKLGEDTFCGTIVFGLFEPFALNSNGTFAATRKDVVAPPTAPECSGIE